MPQINRIAYALDRNLQRDLNTEEKTGLIAPQEMSYAQTVVELHVFTGIVTKTKTLCVDPTENLGFLKRRFKVNFLEKEMGMLTQ